MRLLLIADGSTAIGAGHQVRMASLAHAARAAGDAPLLIGIDAAGSSHGWAWRGLEHRLVRTPAERLAEARALAPDAIVIDRYADAAELAALAAIAPLVAVDDVPGRDLSAARLVLNQNLGVREDEYPPPALVGPRYALLRPAFAAPPRAAREPGTALVMIGGTDPRGLTAAACAAVAAAGLRPVVAGDAAPAGATALGVLDAPRLADALARCALAVIGCGSSVYEAIACAAPFIAVQLIDNQRRIADGLVAGGIAPVVAAESLADITALARRGVAPPPPLVDGRGGARVLDALRGVLAAR